MRQLYNYLYEGLLDIEDTINNNDDLYASVMKSAEFLKHFKSHKDMEYTSNTLKCYDLTIGVNRSNVSFFDFLPEVKKLECSDIVNDNRLYINDENTPSEIRASRYNSMSCYSISNMNFSIVGRFTTRARVFKNVNIMFDEPSMLDLQIHWGFEKFENFSTNAPHIIFENFGWVDGFKQLDELMDPNWTVEVYDVKKQERVDLKIKNVKKLHALINNIKKSKYGRVDLSQTYVKLKNNMNLFKVFGFKDCPNLKSMRVCSYNGCKLMFEKDVKGIINVPKTTDGWSVRFSM